MHNKSLESAIELLNKGDMHSCIYACLELRLAMEKIVHRKIEFYSKKYGKKLIYSKWQPYKALKILCQLDPFADKSYEFKVSNENKEGNPNSPWTTLGRHEALKTSWVTKNYNKLGSFLHLQNGELSEIDNLKTYIQEIINELNRVESGNLISNFGETVSFNCNLCEEKIVCCISALPNLEQVVCSNMNCNATFIPSKDENNDWRFMLNAAEFTCTECKKITPVLRNEIDVGARIKCSKCGTKFTLTGQSWSFEKA